jgi:hypothetical protein
MKLYDGLPVDASTWPAKRQETLAALRARCIDMCASPEDADVLLLHSRYMDERALATGRPFVLYSAGDGTDFSSGAIRHGRLPQCLAILKMYLNDRGAYEGGCVDGRWFLRSLPGYGQAQEKPRSHVDLFDKSVLAWEFLDYEKLSAFMELPDAPWDERDLAVSFAGTVVYGSGENQSSRLVMAHRQTCADLVEAWPGGASMCVRGRGLSHRDYMDVLMRTRVVVSPFGWGEPCYRDYEAILAGCVVVKPRCDWVRCSSGIYQSHMVHWCRADWSDLQEAVAKAMDTPEIVRKSARRWLRSLLSDGPDRYAAIISKAVRRPPCASCA